jgi:hypothetical protein
MVFLSQKYIKSFNLVRDLDITTVAP